MLADDLFPGGRRPVRHRGRRLTGLVHNLLLPQHARNNAQAGPSGSRVTGRDDRLPPWEGQACKGRKAATVSAKASLAYVEEYVAEDEPLLAARASASEVGGASPISPPA